MDQQHGLLSVKKAAGSHRRLLLKRRAVAI